MGDGGRWGEKWEGRRGNCSLGVRTNKYKEEQQEGRGRRRKEKQQQQLWVQIPDPSLISR